MPTHLLVALTTSCAIVVFSRLAESAARRWELAACPISSAPVIFVAAACGATVASYLPGNIYSYLGVAILISALAVSAVSDLRYGYIFDVVTVPACALIVLLSWMDARLLAAGIGGALCAAVILLLFALSAGRGIGLGDLKLAGCIGLALGSLGGFVALGAAFIAGGTHGVYLLASRKASCGDALRFAPYLAFGSYVSILTTWFYA